MRERQEELKARGVRHAALFGFFARENHGANSDIDIMVELDPVAHVGVWGFAEIVQAIESMFPVSVDVFNVRAQRPHVRPSAARDAIYAF